MATGDLGVVKFDVLLRVHGSDEAHEVATVEIPVRGVRTEGEKVQLAPDFNELGRLGTLLTETIQEEWRA